MESFLLLKNVGISALLAGEFRVCVCVSVCFCGCWSSFTGQKIEWNATECKAKSFSYGNIKPGTTSKDCWNGFVPGNKEFEGEYPANAE